VRKPEKGPLSKRLCSPLLKEKGRAARKRGKEETFWGNKAFGVNSKISVSIGGEESKAPRRGILWQVIL